MCDCLLDRLFNPLGFREVAWSVCPLGYNLGATGLYIRADDAVKLGELFLRGGIWNGERLLSKAWIDTALDRGYAFTPVVEEKRGYQKTGANGQKLYFSFTDDIAIAIQSFDNASAVGDIMIKYLG